MAKIKTEVLNISDIKVYANNPRRNEKAINAVMESPLETNLNMVDLPALAGELCEIAIDSAGTKDETGGKKPQPQQFNLPAPVKRTMGIASNFLWDNSTYLLGIDAKKNPERSMKCFKVCKELHHTLLDGKDNDVIRGVLNFFDHWEPSNADNCPVLKDEYDAIIGGANLLFRVNGEFVHDNNDVRSAWQDYYDHIEGDMRQCLVTGKESVIAAVHPAIKGVDGAQSTGAAMVSFNASAFCSYGQDQSYNAPVSKYAAFAYTSALNHLLSDRKNVQKIGELTDRRLVQKINDLQRECLHRAERPFAFTHVFKHAAEKLKLKLFIDLGKILFQHRQIPSLGPFSVRSKFYFITKKRLCKESRKNFSDSF